MKPLDELTAHCIRCGFCLESCPTFLETGQETESPRGRIYLVRSADEGKIDWQAIRPHLDQCLGCRACETACPSGVEYGEILEIGRDRLETENKHRTKKRLVDDLSSPARTRLNLFLGRLLPGRRIPTLLSKLLSGEPPEANKPVPQPKNSWPELDESVLPPIRGEVYLLEGCVMRVLFPRVQEATRRLLRRVGYAVRVTDQGCCGSLHLHAGYMEEARERGTELCQALPDDLPVLVNSAGCGSTMKGYGELIGRHDFAGRVRDISEFLFEAGLPETLQCSRGVHALATYHDACHLAHGQGVRAQPRELLRAIPGLQLIDLPEADMCCGSAGIYNLTQPKMARRLLDRKWGNVETTRAQIVVLGNPGCQAWISQAAQEHGNSVRVLHLAEILEESFSVVNDATTNEHQHLAAQG